MITYWRHLQEKVCYDSEAFVFAPSASREENGVGLDAFLRLVFDFNWLGIYIAQRSTIYQHRATGEKISGQ
jgi:hypothetical protein